MTQKKKTISQIELLALAARTPTEGLTIQQYTLLLVLIGHVNNSNYRCYPSAETIGNITKQKPRAVHENKKALKDSGWITWDSSTGKGNSNQYYINSKRILSLNNKLGEYLPFPYQNEKFPDDVPIEPTTHKRATEHVTFNKSGQNQDSWGWDDNEELPF